MQDTVQSRTPMHLWIVGGLATLWNAFGAYDYWMTRARDTEYLASMMPGVDPGAFLAYLNGYPIWAQFGWGLGVWMGLLGSILLLLRSRWAFHAFALSLVGMVLSFTYVFTGPPMPGEEAIGAMKYFPLVIVAIGVALLYYAHRQRRNGVLR